VTCLSAASCYNVFAYSILRNVTRHLQGSLLSVQSIRRLRVGPSHAARKFRVVSVPRVVRPDVALVIRSVAFLINGDTSYMDHLEPENAVSVYPSLDDSNWISMHSIYQVLTTAV
jgi:hypothetical protein